MIQLYESGKVVTVRYLHHNAQYSKHSAETARPSQFLHSLPMKLHLSPQSDLSHHVIRNYARTDAILSADSRRESILVVIQLPLKQDS